MQILRGQPATLELSLPADLDANPTIAITDANGGAVATGAVTKPAGTGLYESVLPAQANLSDLTAVWSGLISTEAVSYTQHYEIVGNLLFTVAEARGARFTGQQAPLEDDAVYSDAEIARMRALISDQFEQKTWKSWIRRYVRIEAPGSGAYVLPLWAGQPRDVDGNTSGGARPLREIARVVSATAGGVTVDPATLEIVGRQLFRKGAVWPHATVADPFNIVVELEYGDDPVDFEARENGLRMVVANLVPSDVPSYAQNFTGQEGTVTYPSGGLVWPAKTKEWLERNPPRRVPVVA